MVALTLTNLGVNFGLLLFNLIRTIIMKVKTFLANGKKAKIEATLK